MQNSYILSKKVYCNLNMKISFYKHFNTLYVLFVLFF